MKQHIESTPAIHAALRHPAKYSDVLLPFLINIYQTIRS